MVVITAASLTEAEVSEFVGLAAVEDNGEWGVDATAFIAAVEEATGAFLPSLDPAQVNDLSLHLTYALLVLDPFTPYRQVEKLLEFARFLRFITESGSSVTIRDYQEA